MIVILHVPFCIFMYFIINWNICDMLQDPDRNMERFQLQPYVLFINQLQHIVKIWIDWIDM